jgi:hypothetical protein
LGCESEFLSQGCWHSLKLEWYVCISCFVFWTTNGSYMHACHTPQVK